MQRLRKILLHEFTSASWVVRRNLALAIDAHGMNRIPMQSADGLLPIPKAERA